MSITGDILIDYEMATYEEFMDYYEEKCYSEFYDEEQYYSELENKLNEV